MLGAGGWKRRVLEDALLADEYGASPAYFRELPAREFKAHMAILEGKNKQRSKKQKEMKRKRKKAKSGRGGR